MAGQPYTLSAALTTTGQARARTNFPGDEQGSVVTDPVLRSGVYWRYTRWYDTSPTGSTLKIAAQSRLPGAPWPTTWTVFNGTPGLNGSGGPDSHNYPSLGVDPSGRLHVAWYGHGSEYAMLYWRGSAPGDIAVNTFAFPFMAQLSYPRFVRMGDGTLLFFARLGLAGGPAQQVMYELIGDTWTLISAAIVDYGPAGDERGIYVNSIRCNPLTNRLHVPWMWTRDGNTNTRHDLMWLQGVRTSPGVWTWFDKFGAAATLPANNDDKFCLLRLGENNGQQVHGGFTCTADDAPIFPYLHATDDRLGTEIRIATRQNGNTVVRKCGDPLALAWNYIDASGGVDPNAPNSTYARITTPDVLTDGVATHLLWSSEFWPGTAPGARPVPMVMSCYEPTLTVWTPPVIQCDEPTGDSCIRHDVVGWDYFRQASIGVQMLDENTYYGTGTNTSVYVADLTLPEADMSKLTTFAKNKLIDHQNNVAAYTPSATHEYAAFVAGVEKGTRKVMTNNGTTYADLGARGRTNGVPITWDAAVGVDWGDVDEIRAYDASGNVVLQHTLELPVTIAVGGALSIPAGSLDIVAGADGPSDATALSLLRLMFGAVAYAAPATTHLSYYTAIPGTGVEVGSRASITQASSWAASSSGRAFTNAGITLADQTGVTYAVEHTASSGGAIIWAYQLSASGGVNGGSIGAGRLQKRIN